MRTSTLHLSRFYFLDLKLTFDLMPETITFVQWCLWWVNIVHASINMLHIYKYIVNNKQANYKHPVAKLHPATKYNPGGSKES